MRVSWLKVLLVPAATLVATGAGGVYDGQQALAGEEPGILPHFKCYEANGGANQNEPVTLFDQFHSGVPGSTEGGEAVRVKNPQLFCTPVRAKCRASGDCEFFEPGHIG